MLDAFAEEARFDWEQFREVVKVFTRMLDNVVEINGLPLERQRHEIFEKRRHGMGFLGLGSTLTMLRKKYGSKAAVEFTERVARELAMAGWETALELSEEKGPAPIMNREFEVTEAMLRKRPEMRRDGLRAGDKVPGRILHARYSRYMQRVAEEEPELVAKLAEVGARLPTTAPSRRPGRSRCRWPTTPATASSRVSRITISATSSARGARPKRKSTCSPSSCWPTGP